MNRGRNSLRLDLQKIRGSITSTNNHNNDVGEVFLQCGRGRLQFPGEEPYTFTAYDLIQLNPIGTGSYGAIVQKMLHRPSKRIMAVKRIRAHEIDNIKREKMLRELKIIIDSQNCEDIVRFYGALFHDGDCWICMELLDTSLDNLYRTVYRMSSKMPEWVVGFVTAAVIRALNYLKDELSIIHRDVKPSNILLSKNGLVKLCDFGISGYLINSIAQTQDVGCQIYMAPERLMESKQYDIRSDVWSLGISLVEICIGEFPFRSWNSPFDQLSAVVNGDPPFLSVNDGFYSTKLIDFVNQCLIKDVRHRPRFQSLMKHPFFVEHNSSPNGDLNNVKTQSDMAEFVLKHLPE